MASPVEKVESEVEIKSSADKFFKTWAKEAHSVPTMSPASIQAVKVHEGDWESHGSIKQWHYTVDGKEEVFKERMEIDDANKIVTLVGLEGHAMETYKSYKGIFHANPKQDGNGSVVKIILEYEKFKPETPPPNHYLGFLVALVKDIDAHLVKEA